MSISSNKTHSTAEKMEKLILEKNLRDILTFLCALLIVGKQAI